MRVVKFNPKRHKKTPWITDGIIKSINVRNKLYKKLKQCRSNAFNYTEMQANFNRYRTDLKKLTRKDPTIKLYLSDLNLI